MEHIVPSVSASRVVLTGASAGESERNKIRLLIAFPREDLDGLRLLFREHLVGDSRSFERHEKGDKQLTEAFDGRVHVGFDAVGVDVVLEELILLKEFGERLAVVLHEGMPSSLSDTISLI